MNAKWAEKIKFYFTNIWFLWAWCLILNIITFLILYFKIHPNNQTLALHYNVLAGVLWYGKGKNLYFIPAVGLAVSAVNLVLYQKLKDSQNFFPFLCVFASLCAQAVLLASALFLIKVN